MLIVKGFKLQQSTMFSISISIAKINFKSKIRNLQSKIYNLAGSTHLKMCDSCGITILSEILAIRAGNFIK